MNGLKLLIICFLLATQTQAHGARKLKYFYTLKWDGELATDGYELEVYRGKEKNPIIKKILSESEYKMGLSRQGTYRWRVRARDGERVGDFSEFGTIEIKDTILSVNKPMMISPGPGSEIPLDSKSVTFAWKGPKDTWAYALELYTEDGKELLSSRAVTAGKVDLSVAELPQVFQWRIKATSLLGNFSPSEEKFKISKALPPQVAAQPVAEIVPQKITDVEKDHLMISSRLSLSSLDFDFNLKNSSSSDAHGQFAGPTYQVLVEYAPARLGKNHSVFGSFSQSRLSEADKILNQSTGLGEYGTRLNFSENAQHWLYAGGEVRSVEFSSNTTIVDATLFSASARYVFDLKLSPRWSTNSSLQVYLPVQDKLSAPSIRFVPSIGHALGPGWKLDTFLIAEKLTYKPNYEVAGDKQDASVNLLNFGAGVGLTWSR